MKNWIVIALIVGVCIVVLFIVRGRLNSPVDRSYVEIRDVYAARWSADGQSVYFLQDNRPQTPTLSRYDVNTGHRSRLNVPGCTRSFEVSPDGRQFAYIDSNIIYLVDGAGKKEAIYRYDSDDLSSFISLRAWPSPDKILLATTTPDGHEKLHWLDPTSRAVQLVSKPAALVSIEGTLLITQEEDGYHLYDLRTKTDRRLPAAAQPTFASEFLFLSEQICIFRQKLGQTYLDCLDPKTMQVDAWRTIPDGGSSDMSQPSWPRLAPDLRHYFVQGWDPGERSWLRIYRIPAQQPSQAM